MLEANYTGKKKVEVRVNNYKVYTDMPIDFGGESSAPNPFEMFMASFLACQAVFAMSFVEKNNMKKEDFSFRAEPVFDDKGLITNQSGETIEFKKLPPFMLEILEQGGLIEYLKNKR